jgi:leucyl/phenylalanyl-tRNA--protein transferase
MTIETEAITALPAASARRAALFREPPLRRLQRLLLGTAWAAHPKRIDNLPALARLWLSELISPTAGLPDPERTLNRAGLCGIVRDMSAATLLEAYRRGLFTHAHFGPLKWYSLDERCVLLFGEMHIGKNVRRLLRQERYRVTFDADFERVIAACAAPRDGKWGLTWITPRVMHAYADLHDAGHVHSFEVWDDKGALVGGGYGVAAGGAFFTESQFSRASNTSKLGFTVLNWHLAKWGFVFNDGKWATPTLLDLGFRPIPRTVFRARLASAALMPDRRSRWQVEDAQPIVAGQQPGHASAEAARQPGPVRVVA